ncbi:anhydro-N-acetylmuramic acid kinase [Mesonia phycicola]|uniref:Anhydro-N-acetylmuramic acid kinase n=1 Tax=Mesonia phycicola TaxID=579105 RepID=A0A1M6H3E9_9FLAO|nr:anhydro-N-acetylmuramic acid kinase [Mesonia phycicola]SHJ16714.1 anhydro-N-acetylmuramic acid kinase [Mesonia phycicola]
MKNKSYYVLGVMSGTSLDGIDLAYIQFRYAKHWEFDIICVETVAYPQDWFQKLKKSSSFSIKDITILDEEYTVFLAEVIQQFIQKKNIKNLDAVCSHGHTVLHQPENKLTLQIGNLPKLASLLKQKVVCNFRVQDVQFGGQGAPLVPIGDKILFSDFDFCLNLGGFANISLEENKKRVAYDICAVNTVLNEYAAQLNLPYDEGGEIARNNSSDTELLSALNSLAFFQEIPPKSLGVEWVNNTVIPLIEKFQLSPQVVIATFTEHIVLQLASNLGADSGKKVLITGGGAYNQYLIELLQEKTKTEVVIPNSELVEYKEALIFGLLGVLKMEGEINTLSSVTGASVDHSAGEIYGN